jgi:hypothetical protein
MIEKIHIATAGEYSDGFSAVHLAQKLNEVISTVNDLENHIHHLLERDAVQVQHEVTKESAKNVYDPTQCTCGYFGGTRGYHLPGCPLARKVETTTSTTESTGYVHVVDMYKEVKAEAVEAYKKRLVKKLRAELGDWPDFSSENMHQYAYFRDNGIKAAIELVEETK